MGRMEKAKRKTPAPPPAKVDVFNGPAPAQALTGLAQRFAVEYQAAISLKPGGWFVFERAPTVFKSCVRRWSEKSGVKLFAYKSVAGKVIVKRETEEAPEPEPDEDD